MDHIEIERGKNEYSEGTDSCDRFGCWYCTSSGRCIYNIAVIKNRTSRACYNDLIADEIEAKHDYE